MYVFIPHACSPVSPYIYYTEFAEIMAEVDLDGSGELDYGEFLQWWLAQDKEAKEQLMKLSSINFDFL